MPPVRILFGLVLAINVSSCMTGPRSTDAGLRIASWNLEHLAEADGTGCRPRTEADYAALRAYAARLDADVIVRRQADVTALQLRDPDLRSGVDVEVTRSGTRPLRLLALQLKSGCASGTQNEACPVLFRQIPIVEAWIDARAAESVDAVILGDFNRRLAAPEDSV